MRAILGNRFMGAQNKKGEYWKLKVKNGAQNKGKLSIRWYGVARANGWLLKSKGLLTLLF